MKPFDLVIAADPSKRCTGLVAIDAHSEKLVEARAVISDPRDDAWSGRLLASVEEFAAQHVHTSVRVLFVTEAFQMGAFKMLAKKSSSPTSIAQIMRAEGIVGGVFWRYVIRSRIAEKSKDQQCELVDVAPVSWRKAEEIPPKTKPNDYKPMIQRRWGVTFKTHDEAAAFALGMFALNRARKAGQPSLFQE